MCSNRAIVDSLECYMDDLVQCFEDFVKKSLIVISFGMGLIVAMLFYLLKMICERQNLHRINTTGLDKVEILTTLKVNADLDFVILTDAESAIDTQNELRNILERNYDDQPESEAKENLRNMQKENESNNRKTTSVNTASLLFPMPSFDEQVLRDIGLSSCSKPGCKGRSNNQNIAPSRVPVSTLPSSPPKHKSIHSLRSSKHNILSPSQYTKPIDNQGSCISMCCDNNTENRRN